MDLFPWDRRQKPQYLFSRMMDVTIQFSSVSQSGPILCDSMNCSTPGFPVHHQLPELAQTQVHRVDDDIQPSHPLSSPSPSAFKDQTRKHELGQMDFPGDSDCKESACNARDLGSIPGLGRSPGRRHGNSRQLPVSLPGESPWTEEPGGLQSMGLQTVRPTDWLSTVHGR